MFRNKIKYLLLLIISWVLSILYNEYIMLLIFMTILLLPLVSLGIHMYIKGRIKAQLITTSYVVGKGEPSPLLVQLHNPTIFPIANVKIVLTLGNTLTKKISKYTYITSVSPLKDSTLTLDISSNYIGNIAISLKNIKLYDYFKVFSINKRIKRDINVSILPSFYEVLNPDLGYQTTIPVESEIYSNSRGGDDPSEVFDIREYREGDKMQKIHWKLSIKQNQLMIKEFSDPINCNILIFMDLKVPEDKELIAYMDGLLESALSLSFTYMINGVVHYLAWYDNHNKTCHRVRIENEKDLYEATGNLLLMASNSANNDVILQYVSEFPHDYYTNFYYITSMVDNKELYSLSGLNVKGGSIIHVQEATDLEEVENNYSKPRLRQEISDLLDNMDIHIVPVYIENLKENIEQLNLF
ncbi:MAG: DUF58 domain-containing protein [Clostridiales bacterium]|nr:DUF58 domain-containing protein [Clostridiales bacterium]